MCINLWDLMAVVGCGVTFIIVVGGLLAWLTTSNYGNDYD